MRRLVCIVAAVGGVMVVEPPSAAAQEADPDAATTFAFRTSIKASALAARAPDAPLLFPERATAESLFRLRLEPEVRIGTKAVFTLAYEQRLRLTSGTTGIAAIAILPPQAATPYRIWALDWDVAESSGATWRHEIDRASVQLSMKRSDITIGRQALGWGRGVMFSAVDFFAPFSPLEADREWRRGLDAIRADVKLTDRSSFDVVGAFGSTLDASAVGARNP